MLLVCFILGIIIYVDSSKIDTLEGKIAVCEAANKNMEDEAKVQNAAVDKLKADEAALATLAENAEKQAAKNDAPINAQIDTLKAAKSSGEACAAADGLFNRYIWGGNEKLTNFFGFVYHACPFCLRRHDLSTR
ncbi:unnamed protein product [Sphagnum balticum]